MRKQVHLPLSNKRKNVLIMEELEEDNVTIEELGDANSINKIFDEIFQAANNDPNFKICADPETAKQINNCFGREIAYSLGVDHNDN